MAARFWVGGTGTWSNADTTKWSATSGGGSGASVPGVNDTVTFDANSGTVTATLNYSPSLQSLTCTSANVTLSAGANTITLGGVALAWDWQAGTFTAGTSTVLINSAGTYTINAVGMSFYNFNRTGTAVKTDGLLLASNVTVTNVLTLAGNSAINRMFVRSTNVAINRTITANGSITASRLDLQAITGAGSASWDLSGITGGSGDRTDNSGITFTTSATQTATGTASFTWSTHGWTTRVPLPQDDVIINNAFVAGRTITIDMPAIGRDIDFSGVTGSPVVDFALNGPFTHGDVTLSTGLGTITLTTAWRLAGSGSHTLTSNGKTITGGASVLQIFTMNGTYTLQDDLTVTTTVGLQILAGTFDANDHNVTATTITPFTIGSAVVLNMGSGTWTTTSTAVANVWHSNAGGLVTINAETSIIRLLGATTNTRTFIGAGHTYNIVRYGVGNSTGAFVINGDNTFNELSVFDIFGPKTLTFTAGSTQTILDWKVSGSTLGNITVNSTVNGTQANLIKASGVVSADYLTIRDSNAGGGATWYAGANSTSTSNNTGWLFTVPLTQRLALLGTG